MKFFLVAFAGIACCFSAYAQAPDTNDDETLPIWREAHAIPGVLSTVLPYREAVSADGLYLLGTDSFGAVPVRDLDVKYMEPGTRLVCVLYETPQGEQWLDHCANAPRPNRHGGNRPRGARPFLFDVI